MADLPVSNTETQNPFADAERMPQRSAGNPAAGDPVRTGDEADTSSEEEQDRPLFPSHQCAALGDEWQSIQAGFVDFPRASVEKADALVRKTIDTLANSFADMRNSLDRTWEKDREVSTEELRLAFQNYRSFFQRLLSI